MNAGGIVLCGGESKRMGQPKVWLPFGKELMLQRVVRLLREVVAPVVVVAAPGQNLPALSQDVLVVRDEERGRGPLQGIAAGLKALAGRADAAYVSSCDVPFLQPGLVRKVIELLGNYSICVPKIGEHHHVLAAVYRVDVLPQVEKLLTENRLRPFFLLESVPTRIIHAEEIADVDPEFQSLQNLNKPEDYQAALLKLRMNH